MEPEEIDASKRSSIPRGLLFGCLGCAGLAIIGAVTLIIGGFAWLFTGPEGGVRLSNEVERYAVDYIREHQILDADEAIVAYYDATISLNATEAAILTDRRVVYHRDDLTTSINLHEIADVQHKYESLIGDIIVVTSSSGQAMKIEIAPFNEGQAFYSALVNAWQVAQESSGSN